MQRQRFNMFRELFDLQLLSDKLHAHALAAEHVQGVLPVLGRVRLVRQRPQGDRPRVHRRRPLTLPLARGAGLAFRFRVPDGRWSVLSGNGATRRMFLRGGGGAAA